MNHRPSEDEWTPVIVECFRARRQLGARRAGDQLWRLPVLQNSSKMAPEQLGWCSQQLCCVPSSWTCAGQAGFGLLLSLLISSLLSLHQEDFDSEQLSVLASCLQELFKAHFRGEVLPEEITEE